MVGQTAECPFCQHHFPINAPLNSTVETEAAQKELTSLEGQLKENNSQITELRGHVSRLNMELHRHQLRMKTLSDRHAELEAGIADARSRIGAGG